MTTLTADRTPVPASSLPPLERAHVTFPRVVASEWIKFRSVRSTVWTLAITVLLMVGISVLLGWGVTTMADAEESGTGGQGVTDLLTAGYFFAQLTVAVLGVLAVTAEYSTGMIRSTLAAVPTRVPALMAKALVVTGVVAVVGVVALALAHVATLPFQSTLGLSLDLGDASTMRVLLGTPLYLATVALLAFAIGAVLRHSAGAIATILGLMLVVENVFALVPLAFFQNVSPFLPSTAGARLLMSDSRIEAVDAFTHGAHLTPWQGYGVLLAWALVLLTLAVVLLRRRDA